LTTEAEWVHLPRLGYTITSGQKFAWPTSETQVTNNITNIIHCSIDQWELSVADCSGGMSVGCSAGLSDCWRRRWTAA